MSKSLVLLSPIFPSDFPLFPPRFHRLLPHTLYLIPRALLLCVVGRCLIVAKVRTPPNPPPPHPPVLPPFKENDVTPQKKCLKRKKSLNPRNLKNRPCCTHCFVHWYQLFTSVVHFRKVERTVHRISLVYVMNVSLCLSLSLLVSFFCIGLLSVPFFLDFPPLFRLSLRVSMFKGRCCTPVTLMFETDVELRVKKRRERKIIEKMISWCPVVGKKVSAEREEACDLSSFLVFFVFFLYLTSLQSLFWT